MIHPFVNKVYGLVGAVRTGKDSVANFLTETRGFKQMAFADQIKEEFGISKEDFEASKIAGNIEKLRNELWKFSAAKKKRDPLYFINKVIDKAKNYSESVIITDIRTEEEFGSFYDMELGPSLDLKRVYWVRGDPNQEVDPQGNLNGSKILRSTVERYKCAAPNLRCINNNKSGLYVFYQYLDRFFFEEDIEDIWKGSFTREDKNTYLNQFEIKLKESRGQ